eukprot:CAMPEP_0181291330 /NCGR_PEP_ID=MMETSP1101-20121128/1908_1 /TAXON_ID=46948 /ORGANISM="Rhodomonas abbreviata, Strain Caron Lab Isolate" /LENGTH=201 /DNA_ID=CAMNT_0023395711 /DNA_START=184 /DNA_END=786 /DNA_ORIENTATION=+
MTKAKRLQLADQTCGKVPSAKDIGDFVDMEIGSPSWMNVGQLGLAMYNEDGEPFGHLSSNSDFTQDPAVFRDLEDKVVAEGSEVEHPDGHTHILHVNDCNGAPIAVVELKYNSEGSGSTDILIQDPSGKTVGSAIAANPYAFWIRDEAGKRLVELAILEELRPRISFETDPGSSLATDLRVLAILVGRNDLMHDFGPDYEW